MTQEEKQLLLKDLCARLLYGVQINHQGYIQELTVIVLEDIIYSEHEVKPYLRPMSSMTEEESKEFALFQTDFYVDGFLYPIAAINMVNWLNAHHFDYLCLIPKGLALPAPKDMYSKIN